MAAQPTLSVVLTVYNMGECLQECLASIEAQTFADYELICIDDGSTDGSADVIEAYAASHENARVYHQENKGVAVARNAGLDAARGDYVMLLDSDDLFDPTLFEKMVARAQETDADVVVCHSIEYHHVKHEDIPADWILKDALLPSHQPFAPTDAPACLLTAIMGWPWDKIYRTAYLREENLRFPVIANSEDLLFVYLAIARAKRLATVDDVLIRHRVERKSSVSNTRTKAPYSFYEAICLLKSELKKDPATYAALEWNFLNWAFDYTCWNIQTLPEGTPERAAVAADFVEGRLTELEVDKRPIEYFALYPDAKERYLDITAEVTGVARTRTFWQFAAAVCENIDERGIGGALRKTAHVVTHHR